MIEIREEQPEDVAAIRAVNEEAFGQPAEARVVDTLRGACEGWLSLVAVDGGTVVGHVLFSPVTIDGHDSLTGGMGLAPVAVLPGCQRRGIGSRLVRAGLAELRSRSCPFVIVLGHSEYYPRFGFEPASRYGLSSQWDGVPDEAFMVLVFDEPALKNVSGIARYRTEFDEAM
jgi:putative acetyltransferase